MSIVSMITVERDRYAAFFETSIADARARNPAIARELLISLNEGSLVYPYRYLRIDCLEKGADGSDQAYEFWLDPPSDVEGRGFQLGPVKIEIYPFTWCSVQIAFDRQLRDVGKLETALTQWLELADSRGPDASAQAIHSASPIEANGQFCI